MHLAVAARPRASAAPGALRPLVRYGRRDKYACPVEFPRKDAVPATRSVGLHKRKAHQRSPNHGEAHAWEAR